jgi:integrase/recombinase XerD
LERGWRYSGPAFGLNHKLVPDAVEIEGKKEKFTKTDGYFIRVSRQWVTAGETYAEAQAKRNEYLGRQRYKEATGQELPQPEANGGLLSASAAYLSDLELKVAAKNRRLKTLAAAPLALTEFTEKSGLKYVGDISAPAITRHMKWVVNNSPTRSPKTAKNKFIQLLSLLKSVDAVPMAGIGKHAHPLATKDAPRTPKETPVYTYTPEELERFFKVCDVRKNAIFRTFHRGGLRDQELATLRRQDCVLDGEAPHLRITEHSEHDFVPKWCEARNVSIDPELVSILKAWLATHNHSLVFPTEKGKVDGHLPRLCQDVAHKAGMNPDDWWLHKFRATYTTFNVRRGMDLETLRCRLGHKGH